MKILPYRLSGIFVIELESHEDARGYFVRTYDSEVFEHNGLVTKWVQENQSLPTNNGIIRGLHFQKTQYSETKF